jgi:hypothetical protein
MKKRLKKGSTVEEEIIFPKDLSVSLKIARLTFHQRWHAETT